MKIKDVYDFPTKCFDKLLLKEAFEIETYGIPNLIIINLCKV